MHGYVLHKNSLDIKKGGPFNIVITKLKKALLGLTKFMDPVTDYFASWISLNIHNNKTKVLQNLLEHTLIL